MENKPHRFHDLKVGNRYRHINVKGFDALVISLTQTRVIFQWVVTEDDTNKTISNPALKNQSWGPHSAFDFDDYVRYLLLPLEKTWEKPHALEVEDLL